MKNQLLTDTKLLRERLPGIAEKYLDAAVEDMKYLGGGSYGKAFSAHLSNGKTVVLKAYRLTDINEKEAQLLQLLGENTHVEMPRVLFTHSEDNIAMMAMSYISGKNALNPIFLFKNSNSRRQFALDVVKGMSRWHELRGEGYGEAGNSKCGSWREFYRGGMVENILSGLKKLVAEGKFSAKRYELLLRATDKFDKSFKEPDYPVLIHGDLNIMNIMAVPKTFKLTGFIDPGSVAWADRDYDLFQLRNMWGDRFGLYDAYKELHKLPPEIDFPVVYYGAINEAACRLGGGLFFPLWEDLWIAKLKAVM